MLKKNTFYINSLESTHTKSLTCVSLPSSCFESWKKNHLSEFFVFHPFLFIFFGVAPTHADVMSVGSLSRYPSATFIRLTQAATPLCSTKKPQKQTNKE